MLTSLTLTTISVLRHISLQETVSFQELECSCRPLDKLLAQLGSAGLIRVKADHAGDVTPEIYELTRPLF